MWKMAANIVLTTSRALRYFYMDHRWRYGQMEKAEAQEEFTALALLWLEV